MLKHANVFLGKLTRETNVFSEVRQIHGGFSQGTNQRMENLWQGHTLYHKGFPIVSWCETQTASISTSKPRTTLPFTWLNTSFLLWTISGRDLLSSLRLKVCQIYQTIQQNFCNMTKKKQIHWFFYKQRMYVRVVCLSAWYAVVPPSSPMKCTMVCRNLCLTCIVKRRPDNIQFSSCSPVVPI